MNEELALAQLAALQEVPGALRVITSEHACGGGPNGEDREACDAFEFSTKDPRHFVRHDVIGVELYDDGKVRAWTAEGDWCGGFPVPVLSRLLEANQVTDEA